MADKTVTIKPSGGTYTNLQAAITGELAANANLITMGGNLYMNIDGDWSGGPDTSIPVITGFTTDGTHQLIIQTLTAARSATGKLDTTKYILNSSGVGPMIDLTDLYVQIIGLQMQHTDTTTANALISVATGGTSTTIIKDCILVGNGSGTNTDKGIVKSTGTTINVYNCVIYNCKLRGVEFNGSGTNASNLYNCTIDGCGVGVEQYDTSVTIKNCIVFNCTTDLSNDGGTNATTYTASDDLISGTGNVRWTTGATIWAAVFTDYASGNFTLLNYTGTGKVIDAGTDGSAIVTTSDDIIGTSRPQGSAWDMGAFEYVSAGAPSNLLARAID